MRESQVNNLNTADEQIEILKAVIEKRDVFFYRSSKLRERFVGLVPDFRMYRYETSTTQVRSRIFIQESPQFPGTAAGAFAFADTARGAVVPKEGDTLEAWYENDTLNLRPLTARRVVLVPSGLQEGNPLACAGVKTEEFDGPLVDQMGDPIWKGVTYAYQPESRASKVYVVAEKQRARLRACRAKFRTAQLCQTTRKVFRISNSDLHNHHAYHAIFVLKGAVLVSRFALKPAELCRIKLNVSARIQGTETTISGHTFAVYPV